MMNALPPPATTGSPVPVPASRAGEDARSVHPPQGKTGLPSLTGLRFLAALAVFCCHAGLMWQHTGGWSGLRVLNPGGPLGVTLFFILSGFVLTYSSHPEDSARKFWRRRTAKILPGHTIAWIAAMSVVWLGVARPLQEAGVTAWQDLLNLMLVHTFVPSPSGLAAGNGVAWSLACEAFFYLLYPALLPLVNMISRRRLPLAALATALAAWIPATIAWMCGAHGDAMDVGMHEILRPPLSYVYVFPPSRLPDFVLGMLLARLHVHYPPQQPRVASAVLALVAAIGLCLVLPAPYSVSALPLVPLALIIRFVAARDAQGLSSPLRRPALIRLGKWSYAFYLVHFTILAVLFHLWSGGWYVVPIGLALAATLLVSAAVYRFVEYPCCRTAATAEAR
ncbi:acyltransferase [Streptomyces sp. MBT62]|uniref:acyltransferase family protein n=1 Tax=Streptomyces sp. MBT62 TaxID=2800410 RepID=UPI0027DD9AD5|nr:acyltransferase [Streptomyces sp. MBT62]